MNFKPSESFLSSIMIPASCSTSIVTSTYGLDFSSPSIAITDSSFASGHAIRSAEMNCELIEPLIRVLPPVRGPVTTIGAVPSPLVENAFAPRLESASRSGVFGRVLIDASPVSTLVPDASDVIAVKNRSVVPEFMTSITSSATSGRGTPRILSPSPDLVIAAPIIVAAEIVASVSADRSGYAIVDSSESAAIVIARCV